MPKLSQIAEIISGHPFRKKISDEIGGDTLVVQMKDLEESGVDWGSAVQTHIDRVKVSRYLKRDDILLVARGNHNTATLVDSIPKQAVCSPHFFIVRTKTNSPIEPGYLHWFLNQLPTQQYLTKGAQGSDVQSVRRETLENVPIPELAQDKQRSIAALAQSIRQHQTKLKALIENDQRIMDGIAQSLMSKN